MRRGQRLARMRPRRRPTTERSPSAPMTISALTVPGAPAAADVCTPITRPDASFTTSVTRTPSSTRAPAARARCRRIASSIVRRTARPRSRNPRYPWPATNSPWIVAPFGACTRIPVSCAAPELSTASSAPISARMRDACGLMYSEHGLSRGKRARSSTSTSSPARAMKYAADDPAGPPPTMTT